MVDDIFTKAEKIREKIRNIDHQKKIEELEKDFKNKKITKEEYDKQWRQIMSSSLDSLSQLHKEQMKLRRDHSAEPEDIRYSILTDEEAEEELNSFELCDYKFDYLEKFDLINDTGDSFFYEDFIKFKSLDEFLEFNSVQSIKSLGIPSYLFANKFSDTNEGRLIIKDIGGLNSLKFLEELKFTGAFEWGGSYKINYYSSNKLPNIKKLEIEGLWDLNFLRTFQNISDLSIYFPEYEPDGDFKICDLSFLEKLKKLKLDGLEQSHLELISTIKNIEKLSLCSYNFGFSNEDFIDLKILQNYKYLNTLNLEGVNCKAEDILMIKNLKNITYDSDTLIDNITLINSSKIKLQKK